jgi:hypothetical protein
MDDGIWFCLKKEKHKTIFGCVLKVDVLVIAF